MLSLPIYLQLNTESSSHQQNFNPRLFLKDPSADLYIVHYENIFPVHRKFFSPSKLIATVPPKQKFLIVDKSLNFDVILFEHLLGIFYGMNMEITTTRQLKKMLEIIDFLEVNELRTSIENQILEELEQYDTFFVLNLGYKYNLRRICEISFENLRNEEFEQMLYNKFDFMHCDFKLFQIVLRAHQVYQQENKIRGITIDEVEEIICMFCQTHNFNEETQNKLLQKYGRRSIQSKIRIQSQIDIEKLARDQILRSQIVETNIDPHRLQSVQIDSEEDASPTSNKLKPREVLSIWTSNPGKTRKFSEQVQTVGLKSLLRGTQGGRKQQNMKDYLTGSFKEPIDEKLSSNKYSSSKDNSLVQAPQSDSEVEDIVEKVSTLLDEYESTYQQHEQNLQKMKSKSRIIKSMTMVEQDKKLMESNKNLFGTTEFQLKVGQEGIFQRVVKSNFSGSKKGSLEVEQKEQQNEQIYDL